MKADKDEATAAPQGCSARTEGSDRAWSIQTWRLVVLFGLNALILTHIVLQKTGVTSYGHTDPLSFRRFIEAGVVTIGLVLLVVWLASIPILAGLVPLPVRVTSRLLPAIDIAAETAGITNEAERIEAAHKLVHGALQDAVRDLQHVEPSRRHEPAPTAEIPTKRAELEETASAELLWRTPPSPPSTRPTNHP